MTEHATKTDLELLLSWRKGDARMGAQLFARHQTAVINLFRRNVRIKTDIPDLVQRTFLACIDRKSEPQISGNVRGYILGIAFHTMTRFFRQARSTVALELEETEGTLASLESDPEYLLTLTDEQRLLMKAIRRIKIEFQAIIELNYWEGISCDEIAHILGIPEGTARSRLQHGRAAVEKKLAELADSPDLLAATTMLVGAWQRGIHSWIAARSIAPNRPAPRNPRP